MNRFLMTMIAAVAIFFGSLTVSTPDANAASVPKGCETASDGVLECTLSTSNYIGWTLWRAAEKMGVLAEHGKKHGVRIKVRFFPNYDESMKGFNRGEAVALTVTNMDVILSQVNAGFSTEVIVVGTASNGNDAIVSRWATKLSQLVGEKISFFQNSVTDYLWSRFIEDQGYKYKDFVIANTTEDKIVGIFNGDERATAGTWMPFVLDLKTVPGSTVIVDSSMYPEEILDLLVVRYGTPDKVKDTLAGAWFETVGILFGDQGRSKRREMKKLMAAEAQCTMAQVDMQLKTTLFYRTPKASVALMEGKKLQRTMQMIMEFIARQGQLPDYSSPTEVGIKYPGGASYGDSGNVMLRWDTSAMKRLIK